jgi:hypothetical protein
MARSVVAPLVLALVGGCGGNEASPYPPGLAPLDPQLHAAFPAPVDGDPDPEQLNLASGSGSGYVWVHGAAFVHGTLDVVWAAMRDPDVSADRRQVSSYTVTLDDEPQYDYSYIIHNTVNSTITVQFDNSWRHDALEGTKDQPQAVVAGYQKTYGTSFISVLAGSFVARQLDDGNTSLELIEHLEAQFQDSSSTARSTLTDYYASILARVKGQPLPTY